MLDRISLHHIAFPESDAATLGRRFAATGTRGVTLWSGLIAENGLPAIEAMVADHGWRVETVPHVFRASALSDRIVDMAGDRDRLSRAIEDAAALGARSIYMLTGGRGAMDWQAATEAFATAIAPCVAEARDAGVALTIETTTPLYVHLHLGTSLRNAIALCETAGIGLCLDYFACWTEADVYAQVRRAFPLIALVQVSDYVPGDLYQPCRAVPGDGAIPWPPLLRLLRDLGYAGNFDLELVGPRIAEEGPEQAATRAIAVLTGWLAEAGFATAT